ncbi:alkylation response protein AidB-like acyl-CoA dehydrogenase [Skermanella aerolata]|uniref:acyl-CoA dehydrogenase family protein n=1 Tax=Skermanella aerolata TaxID=393310 RepID=UPI003D222B73
MNIPNAAASGIRYTPTTARERVAEFAETITSPVPEDGFPTEAVAALTQSGLLSAPLPPDYGGCGLGLLPGTMRPLLDTLRAVGRVDLSVGRLYEGHCNALQLVAQFGTEAQFRQAALDTAVGHMFAVWNTQGARGIDLLDGDAGPVLDGEKTYCSGVGHISRPIVTVSSDRQDGLRMCLLRADELPLEADSSAWTPLGMAASVSGVIRLADVAVRPDDLIGAPGDYQRQPWFSGGAVRFAAVQLGGAEALLDETITHLRRTGRDGDPYQTARVGSMAVLVESGRAWLIRAAEAADLVFGLPDFDAEAATEAVHLANMTRTAIERICLDVMEHAVRSIGVAGLLRPHPLERRVRDLTTYLRQPAPDAALAAVGRHVLARGNAR